MRMLVTGACGFIGSHMVEVLAEAGHDVVAGDVPAALSASPEDRSRWPEVCRRAGAHLVPLDVTDRATVRAAVSGAQIIFHIAAVFDYLAPQEVLRRVNVEGTRALFEALTAEGSCRRVVNWGAGGVYELRGEGARPWREDDPIRPANPYLASKWDQERTAHAYRARGIEVTSVRPATPYGPRAAYGSGQLLLSIARNPVAPRNLTAPLPFVHVRDLCRAALHLAFYPGADGEAYNVNDDGEVDPTKLAQIVADELGIRARLLPPLPLGAVRGALGLAARIDTALARRRHCRPLLEPDQVAYFGREFRYDTSKLKATGFTFEVPDPEPGLRATLRWYVDNGWLPGTETG